MTPDESTTLLLAEMEAIQAEHGPWTAHNIRLNNEITTMPESTPTEREKVQQILQVTADLTRRPINELRVLDFACLEGLYSVEFAAQGAEVVGIEGREANLAKANFAKKALKLENLNFYLDDVRNFSVEKYGEFDVVLCLGILYHIQSPEIFDFVRQFSAATKSLALINTHVSLRPWTTREFEGQKYEGRVFLEHPPLSSPKKRIASLWSSLDNTTSFWFTQNSLVRLLANSGFSTITGIEFPSVGAAPKNRITLAALKGNSTTIRSMPQ